MSAEVVAVANHKGGVGKSFTATQLAAALARSGWRTLLVDCDAQSNSTSMFDPDDDVEFDVYDVIKNGVPIGKVIRRTRLELLDLLPSTLEVARLDQELVVMHRREEKLREALEPVVDEYDVIVLDLSPNLGPLAITALAAATLLVVPTDATQWGRRAVRKFLQWAEELRAARVLTAVLLGVLLTKFESGTLISKQVRADLRTSTAMFDTVIPKRTGAERMVDGLVVVGDEAADPDLAEAYAAFALEVMQRISDVRKNRGRHRG